MLRLSADEVKKIQLEILDVFAEFCEKRGINYWLDSGTLIGAVRHKGYIPWDDDIDVGMLRPDYDKFMREFNGYNPRYELHSIENDPESEFPFGKIFDTSTVLYEPDERGIKTAVNIDIWPYDNAPDDDAVVNEMFDKRDALLMDYYTRVKKVFAPTTGSFMHRLLAPAVWMFRKTVRLFPSRAKRFETVKKLAENSRRCIHEDTKRIGNFMGWTRAVCSKDCFASFIDAEFEGKTYKIPAGYDEWLKKLYGDYMRLPPEKKRISHHILTAYKLEPGEN